MYRSVILTASGSGKSSKAESLSIRPKKVPRKSAMKPKKNKVRSIITLIENTTAKNTTHYDKIVVASSRWSQ